VGGLNDRERIYIIWTEKYIGLNRLPAFAGFGEFTEQLRGAFRRRRFIFNLRLYAAGTYVCGLLHMVRCSFFCFFNSFL